MVDLIYAYESNPTFLFDDLLHRFGDEFAKELYRWHCDNGIEFFLSPRSYRSAIQELTEFGLGA